MISGYSQRLSTIHIIRGDTLYNGKKLAINIKLPAKS